MKGQTNHAILEKQLQRRLRKNMTDAEQALWRRLRGSQIESCKFRRQHPFLDYVLDFVCLERRLVVEVDGGQHAESARDEVRDRQLAEAGLTVLRFWNNQVLGEIEAVLEVIRQALLAGREPHPHPNIPLEGEGVHASLRRKSPLPPLQGEGRGGDGVNPAAPGAPGAPGAPPC